MNNKIFKEEFSGLSAMFLAVATVIILSCIGNPNALGENLYWVCAAIVFCCVAIVSGIAMYVALSIMEKAAPSDFLKLKRTCIVKSSRLVESWFGGNDE